MSLWLEKDVQGSDVKVTEWSNSFWGSWWVKSMCTIAPASRPKACFIHTPGQKCKTASAALFLSFPSSFWTRGNNKLQFLGWQGRNNLGPYSVCKGENEGKRLIFPYLSNCGWGKSRVRSCITEEMLLWISLERALLNTAASLLDVCDEAPPGGFCYHQCWYVLSKTACTDNALELLFKMPMLIQIWNVSKG